MELEIREKVAILLGGNSVFDFRNFTHLLTKKDNSEIDIQIIPRVVYRCLLKER